MHRTAPRSRIIQSQMLIVPRLRSSALQTFPKVCFMEHLYHKQRICAQTDLRNVGYLIPLWKLLVNTISIFKALRSPAVKRLACQSDDKWQLNISNSHSYAKRESGSSVLEDYSTCMCLLGLQRQEAPARSLPLGSPQF